MAKGRPIIQYIASSDRTQIIGTRESLSKIFHCSVNNINTAMTRGSGIIKDGVKFYFDHLLTEELENV